MSSEIGLELEKSGNQAEAYLYYLAETKKGNVTAAIVRGLVRTTIQVGDILDLLSYFDEITQAANLNPDIASLLKARLLVEIGNYHQAHVIQNSLDAATFKENELVQHFLLKANILAGLQEFRSAIEMLKECPVIDPVLLRREVELHIALGEPEEAITALKAHVALLNSKNVGTAKKKTYITASGKLFAIANQIWLDKTYPSNDGLPTLLESMKIIKNFAITQTISNELFREDKLNKQDIHKLDNHEPDKLMQLAIFTIDEFLRSQKQRSVLNQDFEVRRMRDGSTFAWEDKYPWNMSNSYFAMEESGYVSLHNFGLLNQNRLSHELQKIFDQALQEDLGSRLLLFLEFQLSRILAKEIYETGCCDSLLMAQPILRRSRVLSQRYS